MSKNINNDCHSLSKFYLRNKESRFFGAKPTQNDESGRSMVEMLGVLALIGILSVAGIAGYKTAMTKYRTNELLEEVTKRAMVVASKISLNGLKAPMTPSAELIDEFTNPKGYEFLVSKKNDNQFNILIDTVAEEVCNHMKSLIEMDSPIQWIDDDCTKLTFNNDLSEKSSKDNKDEEKKQNCMQATECASQILADDGCTCAPAEAGQSCNSYDKNVCGLGYYCKPSYVPNCTAPVGDGRCTMINENEGTQVDGHWNGHYGTWWENNSWCIGKGSSGSITYATLQEDYDCDKSVRNSCASKMRAKGLELYYWSREVEEDSCRAWQPNPQIWIFEPAQRSIVKYSLCE